jgi:hypothetical protein
MGNSSTGFEKFADILEKKIRKQIEAEIFASQSPEKNENLTASLEGNELLGSLLTSLNPVHFYVPAGTKKYPHKTVKSKPRPAHRFNPQQAHGFQFMLQCGAQLQDNFNKRELEAAFRALALKLHPDQGGSTEKFLQLLEARKSLQSLL